MKYSPGRDASGKPLITGREAAIGLWLMAAATGLLLWTNPIVPPYTGRAAWLFSAFAQMFGLSGPAIAMWSFVALLLALSVMGWVGAGKQPR